MELDVGAEFFVNIGKQLDSIHGLLDKRNRDKPIHYTVAGSVIQGAAFGEADLFADDMPPYGRVWNILGIAIQGPSTAGSSIDKTGSAAAPAAGGTIVATGTPQPPGVYQVTVQTLLGGTVSSTDANNMQITGGTFPNLAPVTVIPAVNVPAVTTVTIQLQSTATIAVKAIAAATAGSIYYATMTIVPLGSQSSADVYMGQNQLNPDLSSLTVAAPNFSVPGVYYFPEGSIWSHHGDTIFARVYNVAPQTQLSLMARVAEYPVEAAEALSVG